MPYGSILIDTVQSSTSGTPPQFNDGNGTQVGTLCRAWVNFNGTGTVAIRASFNVSSITDNGTGDYTVNFTTALPDANYSAVFGVANGTSGTGQIQPYNGGTYSTTALRLGAYRTENGAGTDMAIVNVAIFR